MKAIRNEYEKFSLKVSQLLESTDPILNQYKLKDILSFNEPNASDA